MPFSQSLTNRFMISKPPNTELTTAIGTRNDLTTKQCEYKYRWRQAPQSSNTVKDVLFLCLEAGCAISARNVPGFHLYGRAQKIKQRILWPLAEMNNTSHKVLSNLSNRPTCHVCNFLADSGRAALLLLRHACSSVSTGNWSSNSSIRKLCCFIMS